MKLTRYCYDYVVNMYFNLKPCLISNYNTDQRETFCEKVPIQIHFYSVILFIMV